MEPSTIVDIFRDALQVVLLMVTVVVFPGLVVGLIVAVFQAATQINEMTLNFLPRLTATLLALLLVGPWLLSTLMDFTERVYASIPMLVT